ncbi:MAG: fumarylacetoacetate hydrolase family protein [Bdellovibrionaceae bacterium]|nr:fumarylacetoacetate hydrolase family protein [Pseudobdellovibrionaceae bacterium]
MNFEKKSDISRQLTEARLFKKPLAQWSQSSLVMSRSEAYQIQELGIQHRLRQSELRIGYKMGLTSEGKRKQMNLDSPLYGELTNKMQIQNEAIFDIQGLIHPKIEPEVAFKIKKTLAGKIEYDTALEAISEICATMEILDSRYTQFKYFSMEDVIADNSSSSHFICGPWLAFDSAQQLKNTRLEMFVDQHLVQSGQAQEISGDPILSVVHLCHLLHENGRQLEAGSIVLAGAATAAVELKPNQTIELKITTPAPTATAPTQTWPLVKVHIQGSST